MSEIAETTELMRTSDDPIYARLRTLLVARNVDPARAWLVEFFNDDPNYEYGIIVTGDRHVYELGFHYPDGNIATAELRDWVDLTHAWHLSPFRQGIDDALDYVEASP